MKPTQWLLVLVAVVALQYVHACESSKEKKVKKTMVRLCKKCVTGWNTTVRVEKLADINDLRGQAKFDLSDLQRLTELEEKKRAKRDGVDDIDNADDLATHCCDNACTNSELKKFCCEEKLQQKLMAAQYKNVKE